MNEQAELNRLLRARVTKLVSDAAMHSGALVALKHYLGMHGYELADTGELRSGGATVAWVNMASIRLEGDTLKYHFQPVTPLNYITVELKI